MFSRTEIELLEQKLRQRVDSYLDDIQEITGVTAPTIIKFFKGTAHIRPSKAELIYETAVKLAEEKDRKRQDLVSRAERLD